MSLTVDYHNDYDTENDNPGTFRHKLYFLDDIATVSTSKTK